MNALGLHEIKVVALAVDDLARAEEFYQSKLELIPVFDGGKDSVFALGNALIMLKPVRDGWPSRPSAQLNPRLTIAVTDAERTATLLAERGVTISDPVQLYDEGGYRIGAFLDSEGNKLWICSAVSTAG